MLTIGGVPGKSDYSITVRGTGDANKDEANLNTAVSKLNSSGRGTLYIDGQVISLDNKLFTAPISLKGVDQNAEVIIQTTSPSFGTAFGWNASFAITQLTPYNISLTKERSEYVDLSATAYTPTEGDWVILWDSGVNLANVDPHFAGGTQSPMELHQIQEYDSATKRAYFADFVVDLMNVSGRIAKIDLQEGVEVCDLKFSQTTPQIDYQHTLMLYKLNKVTVRNIRMDRNGVGDIFANFSANVDISDVLIEGTLKNDYVYGVTAGGAVNKFTFRDSVVYGTRHAFTTTAGVGYGTKRLGTPLNCVISNVITYASSKIDSSNVKTSRVGLDTHPEGWNIIFDSCKCYCCGDTSNTAAQTRSRYTTFKNCQFFGSLSNDFSNNASKGVYLYGYKALVDSCHFDGFWKPIQVSYVAASGLNSLSTIKNCYFQNSSSAAISLLDGTGHVVDGCTFRNCANLYSSNEPASIIQLSETSRYHTIVNNTFIKNNARCSINQKSLGAADVKVLGNTFIGFSAPISSGPLGFLPSGNYGTDLERAYAFSNHYDNISYAGRKSGQDALGLISGTYTLDFSANTYDNKTVVLGSNITLNASGSFSGEHYLLVSQDATGGRTITWNNVNWNGVDPQPKTTGLATSLFQLYHDGNGVWYGLGYFNN